MPLDDINNEDPIEGLGDEILPTRGMPFSEVGAESTEDPLLGQPRDVTAEELASMFVDAPGREARSAERGWLDTASGMGASEPILTDGDFVAMDLPGAGSKPLAEVSVTNHVQPSTAVKPLVTKDLMALLWGRIDRAQRAIPEKIPTMPVAKALLAELERARNLIMAGSENYEEAERAVGEVELRMAAANRARAESGTSTALFLYELIWAICLITFFVTVTGQNLNDQMILVQSAAWGGLGGIAGALYALWKHVARDLDFSKQYALWYITNPIMGAVLGAFVFLVMKFGLLSLSSGADQIEITSPFVIYILAFVVGYQQNVAWDLMRRVLKVFRLGDEAGK